MNKKVSIKAIVVGVLIGLIGSSLASIIAAIIYGIPIDKIGTDYSNATFLCFDVCLSVFPVFLSGYVAGKLGKIHPMRNAVVVGIIQLVILMLAFLPFMNQAPIWYSLAAFLTVIPVAYYGGKVSSKRNAS